MLDEEKLTSMLKTHTQHVAPTPELWDRIARGAGGRPQQRRRFTLPFGLRRGLEVVAVCAVLAGIAVVPLLHHDKTSDGPGGTAKSQPTPPVPPVMQTVPGVPAAVDVSKVYFTGWPTADHAALDSPTVTKVIGWLNSAQVVGYDAEIFQNHGMDFLLVMDLRNGSHVTIRRAEDCEVVTKSGRTSTECHGVPYLVNLITNGNGGVRLRSPELWNWLRSGGDRSDARSTPPSPAEISAVVGALNVEYAGMSSMSFAVPSAPAKITPAQARATTAKNIGEPPADITVTVAYVMITAGHMGMEGKTWNNAPVYLVTYDGIEMAPPTGPVPNWKPGTKGKVTAFIDGNTGEWIQAVTR